jgi:tape measure domain-containing protein
MAAPELRLNVTLDLAAFRTQLGKLAQTSASHFDPVKLTIDQRNFKLQLAQLSKIKPVINIDDSQLDAARTRIGTLNKSLATLRRATSTPIEIKLKYVEVGKSSSAAAGQIGRAVPGRVRADQSVAGLDQKQLIAARNMLKEADVPVSGLGKSRSLDAYRKSIIDGMANAGKESIAGLAQGLKDGQSVIGQAAKTVGDEGVRAIKDALGIASPSRVFKRIGEFTVDGLELGFLNGLKDFKSKSVAEIRKIVALMRLELAKVSNIGALGSSSTGSLRQQLVGQRAYTSPIGPLPMGSRAPWAQGTAGQFGGSGYEPRMVSRPYGQSLPAQPNSFLGFSRSAAQVQPSGSTPGSFLGFSQRATQVTQASGGGGNVPPGPPPGGGGRAVPSGGFPVDDVMVTRKAKLGTAMDVAAASTRNFTASQIPLIGGLKNLAGEFGQAAKQVLLYGTAYKGLAFLTSLPGQILNAAKSQQQFTNGLKVATQDTGTFAKELLYVDNVQRAFGLNLETTRTGFTRLYASMAPTGFDSGSIEKLFTGISAATASLQLTPDKAERVIYAFGQMASKGQIMSEEVKGQLGDVLPGALAIFSKAAGMSVKEFSKAMEDGEFVGNRFREVFAKVSDELMNRFGTGAQAAGRSLQGLINTVGGDFQRTLESFAPLANSAAQAILGPLGGSLKQLAISAQIATGEIERVFMQLKESQQELKDLRDSAGTDGIITAKETEQIRAAEQNVAALTAKYKSLQQAASDPAIARQAQDITKFTEELGKAGTFVMNVAKAIGGMLSPVLNFLGTNLTTVISLITSFYIGFQTARLAAMALMGVLLLYRTLSAILGFGPAALSANALATAFNALGIAATGAQVKVIGLRLALTALVASTVIGAVVGGIMLIAGAFASMRDRAKEASQSSRDAAKAAIDAAQTGGVAQAAMSVQTILGESRKSAAARKALEGIMARSTKAQRAGIEPMSLTMEESVALKGSSLTEGMVKPAIGGKPQIRVPSKGDAAAIVRQFGSVAGQEDLSLREAKSALATAQKVAKEVGLNMPTPGATPPEPTGGDGKPEKERESRIPQLTLELEKTKELSAIEMQIVNAQLMNNTGQLNSLELLKQLVEFKYEAKGLALEDLTIRKNALENIKKLACAVSWLFLKTNCNCKLT